MKSVKSAASVRATAPIVAGLQRLDKHIAASSTWPRGHVAFVKNCHRSDAEDSARSPTPP